MEADQTVPSGPVIVHVLPASTYTIPSPVCAYKRAPRLRSLTQLLIQCTNSWLQLLSRSRQPVDERVPSARAVTYMDPAPAVTHAVPAPASEHVATPAPVTEHAASDQIRGGNALLSPSRHERHCTSAPRMRLLSPTRQCCSTTSVTYTAPGNFYVTPVPAATYAAPCPVHEHVAVTPAVTHAAPAVYHETAACGAPALAATCTALAPVGSRGPLNRAQIFLCLHAASNRGSYATP